MERAFGYVEKVTSKEIKGKTYYGFTLSGDDKLYRAGQINPNVSKGAKVSFNYQEGDYGPVVDLKSLKIYKGKEPATGDVVNKDDYWRNKETSDQARQKQISYQAATNTALTMVNFAIDKGYLKIGAKASMEAYVASVVQLAEEVYNNYQTKPFSEEKKPASPPEEEVQESPEEDEPF
jgi:hypothetical protein